MSLVGPDYDSDSGSDDDSSGYDKRSWATQEQWRWLKRKRPEYLAAQKAGKLGKFLESMYHDFFEIWSECKLIFGHTNQAILTPQELDQLGEAVKKRHHVSHGSFTYIDHLTSFPTATPNLAEEPRSQASCQWSAVDVAYRRGDTQEVRSTAAGMRALLEAILPDGHCACRRCRDI